MGISVETKRKKTRIFQIPKFKCLLTTPDNQTAHRALSRMHVCMHCLVTVIASRESKPDNLNLRAGRESK